MQLFSSCSLCCGPASSGAQGSCWKTWDNNSTFFVKLCKKTDASVPVTLRLMCVCQQPPGGRTENSTDCVLTIWLQATRTCYCHRSECTVLRYCLQYNTSYRVSFSKAHLYICFDKLLFSTSFKCHVKQTINLI